MDGVVGGRRDLISLGRAAEACLHLADHVAGDENSAKRIPGAPKSREYIKDLSKRFRYFSIAKDIANSFKHRKITDEDRRLDGIESLKERWALLRFKDDAGHYFATRKVVLVRLKGGVEIFAEDVIERCVAAWTVELIDLGVIPSKPRIALVPKRLLLRSEVPARPFIEMRAETGEYFESQPILLDYDSSNDVFMPLKGQIGQVEVDIRFVTTPSRFSRDHKAQVQLLTILVKDTTSCAAVP